MRLLTLMPMRPGNPIFDKRAVDALWKNSHYFIEGLGEPKKEGNELTFPLKSLPFSGFKIRYDIEKKFLGRIYVMVLEAKLLQRKMLGPSERIELRYSGFIKKGNAFFTSVPLKKRGNRHGGNRVLQLLNEDHRLIEQCSKLESEFLRLSFDSQEEVLKVEMRPYGGSFIHLMFPPMHYSAILVKEQADLILSIMKRIAELIN